MVSIFKRIENPIKGLFPIEKVALLYLLFTLILIFLMREALHTEPEMLFFRLHVVAITAALWAVYRLYPCRATVFLRVAAQILFLAEWYPDTYEFNRCFNNLDHVVCGWEQTLFGCQPSLLLSQVISWKVVSELLDMGYASFYPVIAVTVLYYFFCCEEHFQRATYVITAVFLLYFIVFIFVPVAGPTFYFCAVGVDVIEQGVFPSIGNYFALHNDLALDSLPTPGWEGGWMWKMVELAKNLGERPTAAFPSSHVGITTACMLLLWQSGNKKVFWGVFPFAFLMFFSTVYIQAHYAIDAMVGLLSGFVMYALVWWAYRFFKIKGE